MLPGQHISISLMKANMAKSTRQIHPAGAVESTDARSSIIATVGTGIAIAVLESDLLPGVALGAAAVLLPTIGIGKRFHPLITTAARSRYKRMLRGKTADEDVGSVGALAAITTGVAVAILQPELLPGIAIGAAASLAPKLLPLMGRAIRPAIKTAIQVGYITVTKTKDMVVETGEQLQDIVAEVRAEQEGRKLNDKSS